MPQPDTSGLKLVCICGLPDHKLSSKIQPLLDSELVAWLYIVRRDPYDHPKVRCYSPPGWLSASKAAGEIYRLLATLYLCLFKPVDAIIGFGLVLHGLYAAFFGWLFRKPVIQLILGKNELTFFDKVFKGQSWLNFALKQAHFYGVRGENTRSWLAERGINPAKVFIPPNVFNFSPFEPRPLPKKFDLISLNNLLPFKRLDIFLQVVHRLKQAKPDIQAIIVGGNWSSSGEEATQLKKMAETLDLTDNVTFAGYVPYPQIPDYLNQARIFIMTSEGDGLPMAMIEAMACGLPCVVPDDADISTVAQHNHNALIVPPGNVEGFAQAIDHLLRDTALYNRLSHQAQALRQEKAQEYSADYVRHIWEGVLADLPNAGKPAGGP